MSRIKLLPQSIIAKIAAGEVIDRPASVLKELIENALDAQATRIQISLDDAGRKKIVVRDNGHGMDVGDAVLASTLHATSKIFNEHDLNTIRSLGFRGEALASIAAVSNLTILTKQDGQDLGTKVYTKEGVTGEPQQAGSPTGTTVMVETLFAHTPARKKFLKTPATELRHVMRVITNAALAHSDISFSITHNGNEILSLPEGHDRDERVRALLGDDIFSELIPLSRSSPHLAIDGFIGKPQIAASDKDRQYLFINGRPVTNSLIARVVKETYGGLLEPRAHPVFVLFLTVPVESIDVNIHPRKQEVKFANDATIATVVERSVKHALESNDLKYVVRSEEERALTLNDNIMDTHTADTLKDMVEPWKVNYERDATEPEILQVNNLYLLTPTKNGVLMVDQHAAHERILYEQFKAAFLEAQEKKEVHTLVEPLTFDLSIPETTSLKEQLETFAQFGFDIESFGKTSFKIRSVPLLFKDRDIVSLIGEVLADLNKDGNARTDTLDAVTERTLSFLACRGAIKAGDYLSQPERKNLIQKLASLSTSGNTCPHGRQTQIEVSMKELGRMFKRT